MSYILLRNILFCLPLFGYFSLSAQNQKLPRRSALPMALKEVSGMTRLPNGQLWMLNDSKNPADLFLLDPVSAKIVEIRHLPVSNVDWEDLCHDPAGNLYIGDFGNNGNQRKNLRIFRYNPSSGTIDSIQFRYPDQTAFPPARREDWNFNCEAMVFYRDSLHIFSKNSFKGDFVTKHYVLPAKPGNYVADLRDNIVLKNRVVTGAALSRDEQTFVLTGYIIGKRWGFIPYTRASAMFFRDYTKSRFLRGKQRWKRLPKCLIARQFESIAQWEGDVWLVANEGRGKQKQHLWRLKH